MILIGQFDSPYVRRVGIALTLYGIAFEHRTWSTFGDADKLRELNPLTRVPTLVLDDGCVLTDSHIILDYLDSLTDRPMFPRAEPARHEALRIATLATGAADKAVSLFYELRLHTQTSQVWVDRCRGQVAGALALLEKERPATPYWFGEQLGHADIAIAVLIRFLADVHAGLVDMAAYPKLAADAAKLEAMSVFQSIYQAFKPPA